MLEDGGYPLHLKRRIRGGKGHLSNKQALQLFMEHRSSFMSHLFLSHLSKNNNSAELVQELFLKHAEQTTVVVASRDRETEVYTIDSAVAKLAKMRAGVFKDVSVQMRMFE